MFVAFTFTVRLYIPNIYIRWNECDPGDLFSARVFKQVPERNNDIKENLRREARGRQVSPTIMISTLSINTNILSMLFYVPDASAMA